MRHRVLRLRVMNTYRHRGRLLMKVMQLIRPAPMPLSSEERACIQLHKHWDAFVKAERWNHAQANVCPTTPGDGIRLINQWRAAGAPRQYTKRINGALWEMRRQVHLSAIYLSLTYQMAADTGLEMITV